MRGYGPTCPPSAGPAEVANARGKKRLFNWQNRVNFSPVGMPLGGCRIEEAGVRGCRVRVIFFRGGMVLLVRVTMSAARMQPRPIYASTAKES